jgi:hypothetical protein
MKTRYKNWTLIDWDGNTELGYKCWRKSFGRGHVSVGVGSFKLIVYSHGANSDESLSSTRIGNQTETDAMIIVDRNKGYHNHKDN